MKDYTRSEEWSWLMKELEIFFTAKGIEETVENTDRIKVILLKCYRTGYVSFQMKDYIGSEKGSWYMKELEFFFTANGIEETAWVMDQG